MSRAICWLRRDLRLDDHRVLAHATDHYDEVIVVFVFDTIILDALPKKNDSRVTFIVQSLEEVDHKLRNGGSQLLVLHGDPAQEIPRIARELSVDAVFCGRDHEPYATQRDKIVQSSLTDLGIHFESIKDQVIFEKGEVLSKSDSPFRIFTPYSRRWLERLNPAQDLKIYSVDKSKFISSKLLEKYSVSLTHQAIGFVETQPWLKAGEEAAQGQLENFASKIDRYGETRDFPAIDGVSHLSAHLRFGTISTREAVRTAWRPDSAGAKKWLMELIWREFYQDILANHPHVVRTTFDPQYEKLEWPGSDEHFNKWCEGMTGFPIVDAAMRCFKETGWMHNRLRMIVASFLTKDLLVDYRKGERYFAELLLDFDLASNNGGWQWAASVGCDAQPYFRIFNPYLQSQKFDAEGTFIRQWVPELADLPNEALHCPTAFDIEMTGYVMPIVEHDVQRKRAISMFEACRSQA